MHITEAHAVLLRTFQKEIELLLKDKVENPSGDYNQRQKIMLNILQDLLSN